MTEYRRLFHVTLATEVHSIVICFEIKISSILKSLPSTCAEHILCALTLRVSPLNVGGILGVEF